MLLRPAELMNVTRATLHMASDFALDLGWVIVTLVDAKTRRYFGTTQMAQIVDPLLLEWLTWFFRELPSPGQRLITRTARDLTAHL